MYLTSGSPGYYSENPSLESYIEVTAPLVFIYIVQRMLELYLLPGKDNFLMYGISMQLYNILSSAF